MILRGLSGCTRSCDPLKANHRSWTRRGIRMRSIISPIPLLAPLIILTNRSQELEGYREGYENEGYKEEHENEEYKITFRTSPHPILLAN